MSKAYAPHEAAASEFRLSQCMELACRTDSLAALRAAVDHGANTVRLKWRMRDEKASVGQPEFQRAGLKKAVDYARRHRCSVSLELAAGCAEQDFAHTLLLRALESGIDEIALSSQSLALYLRTHHPSIKLRLIAGETLLSCRALMLMQVQLGITRVTLPPVISLAQLSELSRVPGIKLEAQATGAGSAIIAGSSRRAPRTSASFTEAACSDGTQACNDSTFHSAGGDPLATLALLPELQVAGAQGVLIETIGRSPARMAQLTSAWRAALDRRTASRKDGKSVATGAA